MKLRILALLLLAGAALAWPTPAALDTLMAHSWPGNARELDNVLQRALLLREGDRVDACDLDIEIPASPMMQPARLSDASRVVEAELIRAALEETGGHRVRAAERLGISERTLRYRLAGMRSLAA